MNKTKLRRFKFNFKSIGKEMIKNSHPQKYWLKMICNCLYFLGLGDSWYEERKPSRLQKYYLIWTITTNFYIFIVLADELLGNFRDDLTLKEKNDLLQLSIAHPIICIKIIFLYLRRDRIRVILKRLIEDNRVSFPSSNLDTQSVRKAMSYFLVTASVVYFTVFSITMDGVMVHITEGIPIRTEVTFFPSKSDSGIFINILRFFIQFHWWYLITAMLLIDGLSIFSLTFTGFKFRRVRLYFESLRGRFSNKSHRKITSAEYKKFWQDFVVGIKLHEDALWCARNVQRALGVFYSVQVVEGIGLLVTCLFKLVTMDRSIPLLLANLFFIIALVIVTGAYMLDGADITYEASLVSTAIFHCGWEYATPRAGLRTLVVMAIQRGQVPVYMTAFGIVVLSYSNFITVLRSSYSFFAVML